LTDDDIESDCFYNILLRLKTAHLRKYYGSMFMSDSKWLNNFASSLHYDEYLHGRVETANLAFTFPQPNTTFHGLPERSARFDLADGLYRLYSIDIFPHAEWNPQGLYSGVPYLTGHSPTGVDVSVLWVNSAETWVDIRKGRANFLSEAGVIDAFIFGGTPH